MLHALRLNIDDRRDAKQLAIDSLLAAHLVGATIRAMDENEDSAITAFRNTMIMMTHHDHCDAM